MKFFYLNGMPFVPDDIDDYDDDAPHEVAELMCVECKHRWVGVYPVETLLKELQCPHCLKQGYAIKTGQNLEDDLEDDEQIE